MFGDAGTELLEKLRSFISTMKNPIDDSGNDGLNY